MEGGGREHSWSRSHCIESSHGMGRLEQAVGWGRGSKKSLPTSSPPSDNWQKPEVPVRLLQVQVQHADHDHDGSCLMQSHPAGCTAQKGKWVQREEGETQTARALSARGSDWLRVEASGVDWPPPFPLGPAGIAQGVKLGHSTARRLLDHKAL